MKPEDSQISRSAGEMTARCVLDARAALGESPVWSQREQCLYWVDVGDWPAVAAGAASSLHRLDPATGESRQWQLPQAVGSFALAADGSAVLALSHGIHRLDIATGELMLVAPAPYDDRVLRFNDGRCDPRGRFWVGTCQRSDPALPDGAGFLYRYDGRSLQVQLEGISVANGLAWSPDGGTMYFADSRQHTVWAFDFDLDQGRASNRRVFIEASPGVVLDGAAVDTQGGYWIALYNQGKVVRYRPDGVLDHEIVMPVSKPTMVAFGGPDLATLYITSAAHRLSPEQHAREPLAGGIFALEPGVAGLPSPLFDTQAMAAGARA